MQLPTGRAFIQVADSGENSIVLMHGANHPPSFDLPDLSSERYSHALFQNEIPYKQTLDAIEAANEAGICTIWNPSPLPSESDISEHGHPTPYWLILNQDEAIQYANQAGANPKDRDSFDQEIGELLAQGESCLIGIVVTLGAEGAWLFCHSSNARVKSGKVQGKIVDTTGAGDCFTVRLPRSSLAAPFG